MRTHWRRTALGLIVFGISFGYVEAAVVVYLRAIHDPIRRQIYPDRPPRELFPLITTGQLRLAAPETSQLLDIEMMRELATMAMLGGAALVATGARQPWLPAFALVFGTWDLFFYVFLKLIIGWPASLLTWDLLFLIPVPWVAPVLAPAIVSLSIMGCGLTALRKVVRMNRLHWTSATLGCLLILASFMWDFQNILAGGQPHPFAWPLFAGGELIGVSACLHAAIRSKETVIKLRET